MTLLEECKHYLAHRNNQQHNADTFLNGKAFSKSFNQMTAEKITKLDAEIVEVCREFGLPEHRLIERTYYYAIAKC